MTTRHRRVLVIVAVGIALLALMWRRQHPPAHAVSRGAIHMGTLFEITVVGTDDASLGAWIDSAMAEVERVEGLTSDHDSTADLVRLNSAVAGTVKIETELSLLIARSLALTERTNGAFDPATGAATSFWRRSEIAGIAPTTRATDSLARRIAQDRPAVDTVASLVSRLPGTILDLGGIAKGYAVDRAIHVLKRFPVSGALVNGGGDIAAFGLAPGDRPWRIGIRHPREGAASYFGVIELRDQAVATSGDYEKGYRFEDVTFHHILDSRTARPARRSVSATVIAQTAERADALATAAFVLGPEAGTRLLDSLAGVEGLIVNEREGELRYITSRGMPARAAIDSTAVRIISRPGT